MVASAQVLERLARRRLRPLRRSEYERLVEQGSFADEKLELLYGRLVTMSPQGRRHAAVIQYLTKLLVVAVGDRAEVRVQLPLALSDESEPEPDLAIVAPGAYLEDHPTEALLIIEVADSSLDDDRVLKAPLYGRAGAPEYWLVNLADQTVEVYREPTGGGYLEVTHHRGGETLEAVAIDDLVVPLDERVLPPRS